MKKLFLLLSFVGMMATLFFVGCQKDVQVTQTEQFNYTVKSPYDDNLKFETLGANYLVKDGYLDFQTQADLNKTINFLRRANPVEIDKWENSLHGFTSIFKNYSQAMHELEENATNLEQIKAKYQKYVVVNSDSTLSPLVDNGCAYGRIIGEKQFYKVGNDLIVLYFENNVISITDGDFNKIEYAKRTLRTDMNQNIFVHTLHTNKEENKPNTVSPRGLATINLCLNSCPKVFPSFSELNSSNNKRLTANTSLLNNSTNTSTTINFDVSVRCNVFNDKKGLWWVGDASGFNWGFGWDITVTSFRKDIFQNTSTQAGGWTWDQFSKHLATDVVIASGTVQKSTDPIDFDFTLASGINVCINREGIRAQRFDNEVFLGNPPRWYCQK